MDTSDLSRGESALNSAADAANKAADAMEAVSQSASRTADGASKMASQYSGLSQSAQSVTASMNPYLAALKQEYDLLGLNRGETEAYIAQAKGLSQTEQQLAAALGAKIDAWNRDEAAAKASAAAQDQATKSADAFIARLQAQADAASKTSAQVLALKAAQLGVSDQAAPLIAQIEGASTSMGHFGLSTAGARTELLRIINDLANGNFSRFEQSAMVLTERMDLMGAIMSPLGVAIGLTTASLAAFAVAAYKGYEESDALNKALSSTADYAGVTAGQVDAMAQRIGASSGNVTQAEKALTDLVASGKVSGSALESVGTAAVAMSEATGQSVDEVVKQFVAMSDDVAKSAAKMNEQYHFLTLAQYDEISALQQHGDKMGAMKIAADALTTSLENQRVPLGTLPQLLKDAETAWSDFWRAAMNAGKPNTPADAVNNARASVQDFQQQIDALKGAGITPNANVMQHLASLQSELAAAGQEAGQHADSAGIQSMLADQQATGIAASQKIAELQKNMRSRQQIRDDDIASIHKYYAQARAAEAANPGLTDPANLSQASEDALIAATNAKYAPKKSGQAGLIDKTQLQGEVQAVKDELDQELAYVKSAQTQLDAQYKAGGLSESQYYQQSRDLLAQKATDEIDAYNKQAALLQQSLNDRNLSAQQKAQINNQIQQDQAKAAKATEDFFSAIADSAAKEDEVWQKYGQSQVDALDKQITALSQQDQALKDQIDTIGMTKAAIDQLVASRMQNQVAMEAEGLAMAKLNDVDPGVIKQYEATLAADQKALKQLQAIAADQSTLDTLSAWQKTIDQIGTDFHNGFLQMLENGKSGWESFTKALKNTFEATVVDELYKDFAKPFVVSVIAQIAGITGGSAVQNALLGQNGSAGALISGANSLIGGVSNLFGGLPTGAATTIANSEGGDVLGNFLSLTGNAGSSAASGASSSAGSGFLGASGLSSGLAGAGLGLGLGSLISGGNSAIGHNPMYATGIGTIAGATVGSVVPVIGTALGAAVGGVLGGVVNKLFGGGETRYGALYDSTPSGTINKLSGPSGGDPAADQVQQQIAATYTQMQQLATSLGGSVTGLGDYRAGYEVSPSKGNSWVKTGFGDDVTTTSLSGVKDSTTVLNDLSLAMQQSVIKGLQEANLDKPYADYLSQFDSSKLSSDQVTQIESVLSEMKSLFDTIKTMGSDFDNLKSASTSAQLSVISLSGGIDQFNTNASYFEQHFVPAAEQTANQAKSVTDQLAALGESSVTTNDQFRQVVQGIDLTTAAGQQLYAQMLALAPAFDQMTQAAQQAADAQQSLWNQYFSAIYTPDQQLAMSTKQLQAQFDALGVAMPKTNADFQALVENMDTSDPTVKALQNSLLALAPAFAQVTSASDQAAQAAAQAQQQAVQTALGNVQTAYDNQVQAINANITSISNFITQLTNLKQSLSLGSLSTLSPQDKYAAEKQLFEQTSAAAASGDATAQGNLPQVAQDFLTASQAYNASSQAYVDDYNEVQSALDKNIASAQQQLSVAQQQLDATNQMVQGILDLNQTAMTLEQAVTAYFAAGGTTSAAAGAAAAGTYGGSAGGNLNRAQVEATADPATGLIPYSDANPYGPMGGYSVADWQAANGAVSDATKAAMGMMLGPDGTYGWYAGPVNGSHAGGLDSVPFDGYRAELHKGEAVVTSANNQKLSQMLNIDWSKFGSNDNAALVNEIKSMRAEMVQMKEQLVGVGVAQMQQAEQHQGASMAALTRQTRQLQTVGDNTGRIASKR